ncbi:MAG: M14 family zinc carboxypeptidase [bacterium]
MNVINIILFCIAAMSSEQLDLVRINVTGNEQIKQLDRIGVVVNQVYPDYIIAEIEPHMYDLIFDKGFDITLLQKNISNVYLRNSMQKPKENFRGQYLTYEQIRDSLITIATNHPGICHLETLGVSHQNRLLLIMKISDNADTDEIEPALHFEGNIHGNEKIAWAVNFNMISYLVDNYVSDTMVQRLVNEREIWIAPLVNPDGYANNSRYNGRGVDVNRNWGWMWGNEYNCGNDFMSENESWRFMEHFWRHPFVSYASYHSGTIFISEPWSYTSYIAPPEQNLIRHLSVGYASYTSYPYGQGSIGMYPINGATKDYDYGSGGEIGWSIEVCYTKTPPPESIDVIFERDKPAMLLLMHKAGQGIGGQVTDSLTGEPLRAMIYVNSANWQSYSCPINGDFHRFYLPGTYDVTLTAPGYVSKTIDNVIVPAGGDSSVYIDVELTPNSGLPIYATRMIGSGYVTTSSNMTYPVRALGLHDSQAYQLDVNKWIVLGFDFPIRNGAGNDLSVYRSTGSGSATVMISNDWRGSWQTLGTANSSLTEFDIASVGMDSALYVRLQGLSQFMLDAIEAVQITPGITEYIQVKHFNLMITPTILRNATQLAITNPGIQPIDFQLYNCLGQKVHEMTALPGTSYKSLKGLAAGIYFVKSSLPVKPNHFVIVR